MGNCRSKSNNKAKIAENNHSDDQDNVIEISVEHQLITSTRAELNLILKGIHQFQGTTESDKNYRYLDEMLTRCILDLDKIQCNNMKDRSNRKQAIKDINQAISILERKLEINSDIKGLESNLNSLNLDN